MTTLIKLYQHPIFYAKCQKHDDKLLL